jgi:hypothetical protein
MKELKRRRIVFDRERHDEAKAKLKIDRAVRKMVDMGLMEVMGRDAFGRPTYCMTEEGKRHPPSSWSQH